MLKVSNDKDLFLVKWANFPDEDATWEPRPAIPDFILDWYEEDFKRLGSDIPSPTIKWTKEADRGQKFHFLSWGKPGAGTWVGEEQLKESIFDLDLDAVVAESSCNTRKEKDKRVRR